MLSKATEIFFKLVQNKAKLEQFMVIRFKCHFQIVNRLKMMKMEIHITAVNTKHL